MAYYKLIRQPADGKAVRGTIYQTEHRYSGSAGEYKEYLTPVCDTLENTNYLVPALIYKVQVSKSPKFQRLLPLLEQVPGRSGIRFHRGSQPEHSKGCILVSAANEQELTARFLAEQRSHEECRIDICNHTNLNLK
jgi:hypothetical protein